MRLKVSTRKGSVNKRQIKIEAFEAASGRARRRVFASISLRTLVFGFTTAIAGSVRACDRVAGFLISISGSVVMYVFSVITSVTGSGTTAGSMLTTAGSRDRFATDLVRGLELYCLRFVFRAAMSSPR